MVDARKSARQRARKGTTKLVGGSSNRSAAKPRAKTVVRVRTPPHPDVLRQLAQLQRQVARLEDIHAVRTLHFKYGYYIDMCLYDEACALFAEDGEVRFLNGIYKGKAGVRRLYCDWFRNLFTKGRNGPTHGLLLDHLQLQDVVDISADGSRASARFRALMLAGQHESKRERIEHFPEQCWEGGIYENLYLKDRGVWKIKLLNYNMLWQADYAPGWAKSGVHLRPITKMFPEDPHGPDELLASVPGTWPNTRVVPFHYAHPVTGKPWEEEQEPGS
jgi:hypothetical protein